MQRRSGPVDGLPDPPDTVGGKLVPGRVIEFLRRAQQTEVAVLDEVNDRNPAAGVLLGDDADHQAQVSPNEPIVIKRRTADVQALAELGHAEPAGGKRVEFNALAADGGREGSGHSQLSKTHSGQAP